MQFTALLAFVLVSVVAAAPSQLASRTGTNPILTIHPNGDQTKCVGVLGGQFIEGSAVDIFDCNGSATQKWISRGTRMINPADGSIWALDVSKAGVAGVVNLVNGVKVVLNKSHDDGEDGSPYQSWNAQGSPTEPQIRLNISQDKVMCLDLTDGSKANKNTLQIWECAEGNTNQAWTYTSA
ncbi:ricin B lectin domain-containing protein [Mycena crocata]|nr:ricin B lectin domain-containing protein [Mycena crocata]